MTNVRSSRTWIAGCTLIFTVSCGVASDISAPGKGDHPAPGVVLDSRLYGPVTTPSCGAGQTAIIREAARLGKIAASSSAFAKCVRNSMVSGITRNGPYKKCRPDPFLNSSLTNQIDAVLEVSRSLNPVEQTCGTSTTNVAMTQAGPWGQNKTEKLTWSTWITAAATQVTQSLCTACTSNAQCGSGGSCMKGRCTGNCRQAAYPWPYSDAANTIWHEVLHQNSYEHGEEPNSSAAAYCQPPGADYSTGWNFDENTAPFIVGTCLSALLDQSAETCGNINQGCGAGLKLLQEIGSSSCVCVREANPIPGIRRMITYWHGDRRDHATFANDIGKDDAINAGYSEAYEEGFVLAAHLPQTVPLKLFWSAPRNDHFTASTAQSITDATNAGYAFVRDEGRVYPTAQPGTVALKLYWSAARQDNLTTSSPAAQSAAVAAGYVFVRDEGYVFRTSPVVASAQLWNGARGDNAFLTGSFAPAVAAEASAPYFLADRESGRPMEPPLFNDTLPGTQSMAWFFHSARGDHMAVSTTAGVQSAIDAGYSFLFGLGRVFVAPFVGAVPLQLFWHGGREDNLTTGLGGSFSAIPAGYSFVRVEGWTLPTARYGERCPFRSDSEACSTSCPCGYQEGVCASSNECAPGLACSSSKCR